MYANIRIPDPFGWVDGWLDDINPFKQLAGMVSNGYTWMVGLYEELLVQIPGVQDQKWVIDFLNDAFGQAQFLSIISSMVLIAIVLFKRARLHNAVWSVLMTIFLLAAGQMWYMFCYFLMSISSHLSESAQLHHTTHSGKSYLLYFDPISSVLGASGGYGILLVMGLPLFCQLLSYSVVNIIVMGFGIIGLALRFVGKISEKMSDLFVSIALVTMLFGKPAAILSINIGRELGDAMAASKLGKYSGAGPFMGWVGMASGFWWAFAWQIILFVGMTIAVSKVTGHVNALSQVFGRVDTKPERHEVDVTTWHQEHANGQRPITHEADSEKGSIEKVVHYVKEEGKHQLIAAGAGAVAAAATGGSSAVAQVGATAAARVAQNHTPRKGH
jgi:hypothetical protein